MIVLLDCDGPLADFTSAYLNALHLVTGLKHAAEEVDRWAIHECEFFARAATLCGFENARALKKVVDREVVRPGFCHSIPVQPGAKEAVKRLHATVAAVYVVTSPWDSSPTWEYERKIWLYEHFGIPRTRAIQTGDKTPVFGDLFLDDKPSHVQAWGRAWPDSHAVLFDMHHNRSEQTEAPMLRGDWSLVHDLVEKPIESIPAAMRFYGRVPIEG